MSVAPSEIGAQSFSAPWREASSLLKYVEAISLFLQPLELELGSHL